MKNPHFFKAKSRIGIVTRPKGQEKLNVGVEDAPEAILTTEFLREFTGSKTIQFIFPIPEYIDSLSYNKTFSLYLKNFKNLINDHLEQDQTQVVVGGDHSVTLASILADFERLDNIQSYGLIHFDSHGDMNLNQTSPTGNFHGMYLRPFFDEFDIPEIKKLVNKKIDPKKCILVGNLDLDYEEGDFIEKKGFHHIDLFHLRKYKQELLKEFEEFINKLYYLHISFDIDVFDKREAPATGIPAEDGFFKEDIFDLLKIVSKHSNFSFDLCEVNPKKEGEEKTVLLAQEILRIVLD